jgi:hypothetical protein
MKSGLAAWWHRQSRRGKIITAGAVTFVALGVVGAATPPPQPVATAAASPTPSPSATATGSPSPVVLPSPSLAALASPTAASVAPSPSTSPGLTAAQVSQVRKILTANVKHYEATLAAGQRALGTTRYQDAFAGLAAFDDPKSAASRFRDWRLKAKVDTDVSYVDAARAADDVLGDLDEPEAVSAWTDHTGDALTALIGWANTAPDWQIRAASDADLAAAADAVKLALDKAKADIAAVR